MESKQCYVSVQWGNQRAENAIAVSESKYCKDCIGSSSQVGLKDNAYFLVKTLCYDPSLELSR